MSAWRRNETIAAVAAAIAIGLSAAGAEARPVVGFPSDYSAGTIVISQSARKLYLVLDSRSAIAYPVAVAKPGKEWSGYARVDGKYVEPAWAPPTTAEG